jgi:hypothetical protein
MGVRSWRERRCRPCDRAPKYVESWSTGYASRCSEGKPTVCSDRKAAVLDAPRRVGRTPPGSESGACFQRGARELGRATWSPWVTSGVGVPTVTVKTPGVARRRPPRTRTLRKQGTQSPRRDPRHQGRRGSTERPRDGPGAVLVEYSTDGWELCAPGREGGAPMSQGPTGRKAKPGITFSGRTYGRASGLTNRIHETPENCPTG